MIEYDLDKEHSILHVQPKSPLEQDDFVKLAKAVDPYIEATGGLAGLIIEAPAFPGRNRQDLWIGCVGAWPVYGSSWWASCSALSWWMALSMASGSVRSMPLSVRAAATFLAGPQAVSLSKASSKTGR